MCAGLCDQNVPHRGGDQRQPATSVDHRHSCARESHKTMETYRKPHPRYAVVLRCGAAEWLVCSRTK
ncbi:hypothetical protein E2C01_098855 [Portunus trituberculatus]|uniref:Uncharacterized protein n=1 Tax=Portunus trituberculatus TaxID=210409 RepID=A0A5B7K815_PORTR|nr:hypothetical protein [Portunus trituberculatus]